MPRTTGWMLSGALLAMAVFVTEVSAAEHKLTGENTKVEFLGTKSDGKHSGGTLELILTPELSHLHFQGHRGLVANAGLPKREFVRFGLTMKNPGLPFRLRADAKRATSSAGALYSS